MGVQRKTPSVESAIDVFLFDRRAQGHTQATQNFYRYTLGPFSRYLSDLDIARLGEVNPNHIRQYLVSMRDRRLSGHTINGAARSLRAFFQFLRPGGIPGDFAHDQS